MCLDRVHKEQVWGETKTQRGGNINRQFWTEQIPKKINHHHHLFFFLSKLGPLNFVVDPSADNLFKQHFSAAESIRLWHICPESNTVTLTDIKSSCVFGKFQSNKNE